MCPWPTVLTYYGLRHAFKAARGQKVKKLLLETNYTLDAIASMCGYENGSYLSRVFRSKMGMNASEFRKNNQI
ncbi:helix-turn-helix domain-containing protein [Paenibacillus sp. NPDC056579]|uniref:helix-turn-helix domain-containing protein n=1 Tax=Paenibacillus sp. NPDC056579 TaxID=3345871 RepID=UPI00368C2F22